MSRLPSRFLSLRAKFTIATVAPLVVTLLVVTLLGYYLIGAWIVGETQKKVRGDLDAARAEVRHERERLQRILHFSVYSVDLARTVEAGSMEEVRSLLAGIRAREEVDLLTLTDATGRVVARGASPDGPIGQVNEAHYVDTALSGVAFSGTILMPARELQREGLAAAALIKLRPQEPRDRSGFEERGMFLLSAFPLKGRTGEILGCLYGGILLNHNNELVERIKRIIYGDETYEGTGLGSATLFLEDVRAATTVRLDNGARAVGTFMSPRVARTTLVNQKPWIDRALVVDNWYLSAYEPVLNARGNAIGALYVGLLEAPFSAMRRKAALTMLLILFSGSAFGFVIARIGSRSLSRPILELEQVAQQVASGERDVHLPVRSRDELGLLTEAFNGMTDALHAREEDLRSLNRELESKVRERTLMLEEKSQELLEMQKELARAEKLAAIGALAAGVAHEINNPTAIIRGNTELILMEIAEESPGREEAEEVMKQTERIGRITQNLLSFARRQAPHLDQVDLNDLVNEILAQLRHQVNLAEVTLKKNYDIDLPLIPGDAGQLRQVFTNILVNAVEAMGEGGILIVATDTQQETVSVSITDTGGGIAPEQRENIFNPFYSTKKRGTGLGLSVSFGIIERHGGVIEVQSQPGRGTTFTVRLPRRQG